MNACMSDNSMEDTNETAPCQSGEGVQESVDECVTPFYFVGIKMEGPDDYESDVYFCGSPETQYSSDLEYPRPDESLSTVDVQCSEGLQTKLNSPSCIFNRTECVGDVDNCESDTRGKVSVVESMRRLSDESVKGIECQKYPVAHVKEEENADERCAVNRSVPAVSKTYGSAETLMNPVEQEQKLTSTSGEELEPFRCPRCDAVFISKIKRDVHLSSHSGHPTDVFPFEVKSESGQGEREGMPRSTGIGNFSCNIPPATLARTLKRRPGTHTCDKSFPAGMCKKSLNDKYTEKHMDKKSLPCSASRSHSTTVKKPFVCGTCKTSFSRNSTLTKHMMLHTGEKPFTCDSCEASFRQRCHLIVHQRTHTGEKPFSCGVCKASFIRSETLKKHLLTHSAERPFTCDSCEASFTRSTSLKVHMRIHTGEKPFLCGTCDASFTDRSNLVKHIRTHTGEKPFQCCSCQALFSDSSHLKRHLRIHSTEQNFL